MRARTHLATLASERSLRSGLQRHSPPRIYSSWSPRIVQSDSADCLDHILHIFIRHAVKHRQTDQALVSGLGHGKFSALVTKAVTVIRMKMDWNVVHVHADVLRPKGTENLGSAGGEFRQIHTNWIQVPGWRRVVLHCRNYDCRNTTHR